MRPLSCVEGIALAGALVLVTSAAWAQAPAGGEFRVNTFTTGHQYSPAAAFDREGDFVVVWSAYQGPAQQVEVVGQRYAVGGVPIGGEFIVNATTSGFQYTNQIGTPIAMRPDGRFVVAWSNAGAAGGDIRARRFEADGVPSGAELVVDPGSPGDSYYANVAMSPLGSFVVVWTGNYPADPDVFARRFDAGGTPVGAAFRVNTDPAGEQTVPRVATDSAGAFAVVWQDRSGRDGDGHGVFGQRFDPAGQRLGAEFQVNTYTTGNQYVYSVSRAADGRFVVAWDSSGDGDGFGVFSQRYDAAGTALGGEFQVNTVTSGSQSYASISSDEHFRLVATWQSTTGDGSGFGIRGQAFDDQGAPRGSEFRVNTYTTFSQQAANAVMDDAGNFLVTWHGDRQDGSDLGVFAQRFEGLHPRSLRADIFRNGVIEPGEFVRVHPSWANVTSAAVMFGADHTNPEGPPGGVPLIVQSVAIYDLQVGATGECTICPDLEFPDPSPRPAVHWDGAVTETVIGVSSPHQRKRWLLHVGASFSDVPAASPFYPFVETLLHHGVTGGCGSGVYCPASITSREEMAVFVLVAKDGVEYVPPACGAPMFADLPSGSPFCRWVEELARRGVVSGCGGGNYCPAAPVSREQMAVFVLRTYAPALAPPACAAPNLFADVPETSPFCGWVEELARRGVVTGCGGGNYCPGLPVTREQMGVFIAATFGLSLYGP